MDRRVTQPKRVTSATLGPPPPCKRARDSLVTIPDSSFSWSQGNGSFRYKVVSIRVVSTQAVKLHKNVDHSKFSLRVNKEKILGEYSSFFKPCTWN